MSVVRIRAFVFMLVIVAGFTLAGIAFASTYNGIVEFTCVNADAAGTGSHVLDRDNTGTGQEALRVDIFDGQGTLIYTLSFSNVLNTFAGGIGDFFYTTAPQYNPIRFVLTSLAGNGLPEQIDFIAEGSCAGLPTYIDPSTQGRYRNQLPDGSVVGNLPFDTQAYWAPGEISTVVVNAGNYHVVGVDESGEFYKIWLSGEFLWIPVGNMQPSFEPPWSGQPLPTRVVS